MPLKRNLNVPCGCARYVISGPNSSTRPRPSGASTTAAPPFEIAAAPAPSRCAAAPREANHATRRTPPSPGVEPEHRARVEEHVDVALEPVAERHGVVDGDAQHRTRHVELVGDSGPRADRPSLDQRVRDRHAETLGDGASRRRWDAACRRLRRTASVAARCAPRDRRRRDARYSAGTSRHGGAVAAALGGRHGLGRQDDARRSGSPDCRRRASRG